MNQKNKWNSVHKSKHVAALQILRFLVYTKIYTLPIRKYNNHKCKATTLVMMQILLLIMKDYKNATVFIIIMFPD